MSPTFPKSERLSGRKIITQLFESGESLFLHPFKILYLPNNSIEASRILISVPKRNFKKAVDRNLLKRRIREAYRLNKHIIQDKKYDIACIYIGKEILTYSLLEKKLSEINSIKDKDTNEHR